MMNRQADQSNAAQFKPKAFINVIFFDEQFKAVDYRVSMVGNNSTLKDHYAELQNIAVPKNGFVYIYCSNESPVNVFFDNLQVVHTRGPILEETHYYPFGLTMAGISSKSAGSLENKKKFNRGAELQSKEFSDGSGLELYTTFYRSLDPQIGRWWQIDPKPDQSQSPYSSMNNNPLLFNDPLGDTAIIKWNSGFLGLGKRHEIIYVGGQWIDSRTRNIVNAANISKKNIQRTMNDYSKLNTISDFNPVTSEINSRINSINLIAKAGSITGGSETQAGKYFNDLILGIATPDINVNLAKKDDIDSRVFQAGNGKTPSYIYMGHELGHVLDILQADLSTANFNQILGLSPGITNSEINAMYWENILRHDAGLSLRTYYNITNTGVLELPANITTQNTTSANGIVTQTTISSLGGTFSKTF
jgi:RHS repeat-associated protein